MLTNLQELAATWNPAEDRQKVAVHRLPVQEESPQSDSQKRFEGQGETSAMVRTAIRDGQPVLAKQKTPDYLRIGSRKSVS
jgi:hypothetical protein